MEVVAAVLEDAAGRLLLARRAASKPDGGLWEFPGGKLDPGESAFAALARELREELGIEIDLGTAARFMSVRRARADGPLALQAWRVANWRGDPRPHEHAALRWCSRDQAAQLSLCDADVPILRALQLPSSYAITATPDMTQLPQFLARVESALQRGLRMLQFRAPQLSPEDFARVATRLRESTHRHKARLLLNAEPGVARALGADGVHLSAARMQSASRPLQREAGFLIAASCHNAAELMLANELAVDFVVVSPVRATASHADAMPLGWDGLRTLLAVSDQPAYALGGVGPQDLATARLHGCSGVAGISAFW